MGLLSGTRSPPARAVLLAPPAFRSVSSARPGSGLLGRRERQAGSTRLSAAPHGGQGCAPACDPCAVGAPASASFWGPHLSCPACPWGRMHSCPHGCPERVRRGPACVFEARNSEVQAGGSCADGAGEPWRPGNQPCWRVWDWTTKTGRERAEQQPQTLWARTASRLPPHGLARPVSASFSRLSLCLAPVAGSSCPSPRPDVPIPRVLAGCSGLTPSLSVSTASLCPEPCLVLLL